MNLRYWPTDHPALFWTCLVVSYLAAGAVVSALVLKQINWLWEEEHLKSFALDEQEVEYAKNIVFFVFVWVWPMLAIVMVLGFLSGLVKGIFGKGE